MTAADDKRSPDERKREAATTQAIGDGTTQALTFEATRLALTIKTLLEKGDKAAEKAEQFYIAAGQHLKTLKSQHDDAGGTWAQWESLLRDKIGIGKSRASELMQIADGRKTVESVRATDAEKKRLARATAKSSPGHPGENASTSIDTKGRKQPARKPKPAKFNPGGRNAATTVYDPDTGKTRAATRADLLDDLAEAGVPVAEVKRVIEEAKEKGGTTKVKVIRRDGTIKKLVASEKRRAREEKKQGAPINEWRAEAQPQIDALAAQLVALDHNIARRVLSALAGFGPCGSVAGLNLVLALPFALALEKALNEVTPPETQTRGDDASARERRA
jgi:hypothetical protein